MPEPWDLPYDVCSRYPSSALFPFFRGLGFRVEGLDFGVSLLKLNIGKKGTLIIRRLLGNLDVEGSFGVHALGQDGKAS